MNRQTKRQMARQGADRPRAPERKPAAPAQARERTTPRQFLHEVNGEMRKVAWPTRAEVFNSSLIVLIGVTVMASVIFGYDYAAAKFVLFLFD